MVDHVAIGRRNRRAGKEAQREFAHFACDIFGVDPEAHASHTQHHPDVIFYEGTPADGIHVEVKWEKELSVRRWLAQTIEDAPEGQPWLLVFRRPRSEWRRYGSVWYVALGYNTHTAQTSCPFTPHLWHTEMGGKRWRLRTWIPDAELNHATTHGDYTWAIHIADTHLEHNGIVIRPASDYLHDLKEAYDG